MNGERQSGSWRWRSALIGTVAVFVIGCGSNSAGGAASPTSALGSTPASATAPASIAPPSESPPGATDSPAAASASTADVGAAFLARMNAFDFSARSAIAGELDVAGARYGISGALEVSGPDSHSTLTIAMPGGQADESIVVAGRHYHRIGNGPWFIVPPEGTGDLSSFLRTVTALTDQGIESKAGRWLHHLALPAGTVVPPTALGLTGPTISNVTAGLEFWATDDGTVAAVASRGSFKEIVAGVAVDATMTVEYTFSDVGTAIAIDPPAQVWVSFTSKSNHLSIGYPEDWDVFKATSKRKFDEFDSPEAAWAIVSRYKSSGYTLNQLTKMYAASTPSGASAFHVDKVSTTTMGGLPARQLLVHATWKGVKQYWIETIVLKDGYFYEVDLNDGRGHEAADRTLANQFIATVVIG